jgi:hypothetical protein
MFGSNDPIRRSRQIFVKTKPINSKIKILRKTIVTRNTKEQKETRSVFNDRHMADLDIVYFCSARLVSGLLHHRERTSELATAAMRHLLQTLHCALRYSTSNAMSPRCLCRQP